MIAERDEPEGEEEAAILRRIVAFLLDYFKSRGLIIDEVKEPAQVDEDVDAVLP